MELKEVAKKIGVGAFKLATFGCSGCCGNCGVSKEKEKEGCKRPASEFS